VIAPGERGFAVENGSGVVTVSVLAMVLAAVVAGGVVGLVLGSAIASQVLVAFICALVGAILALVVGYRMLGRSIDSPPAAIFWNVILATLLGALAGHELSVDLRDPPASPLIGGLSAVLAALLIVSFLITLYMLRDRRSDSNR
jgi:hypothetical protein